MSETNQIPDYIDFGGDSALNKVVRIDGPDGKKYILRSGSGKTVADYRNAAQACFKYGANGRLTQIVNLASVEVQLVAGCLFETGPDGEVLKQKGTDRDVNVPQQRIDGWPNPIKSRLFAVAKQISGLDEDTNPLRVSLEAALRRDDSPLPFQAFKDWVLTLPDDVDALRPLRRLLEEEPAKNVPAVSTGGSE